jgi:hypothetical protein
MIWLSMLPDTLGDLVRSEIEQIDDLFQQYAGLLDASSSCAPDLVQRAALAAAMKG